MEPAPAERVRRILGLPDAGVTLPDAPTSNLDVAFAAAFRASAIPMVLAEPSESGRPIVHVNDAFLELTGYRREEVVGRDCRLLQGPGTSSAAVARIREALDAGRGVAVDLLNYRKDGSAFWNALSVSPVRNARGEIIMFLGAQYDVTERKEAEGALLRRRDGLEAAMRDRAEAMEEVLKQKTALLHEVDHRVKNNLQLISSLVLLQSRRVQDPVARDALRSMLERVSAIATVHRRLFQSEEIDRFDVAEFIRDLVTELLAAENFGDVEVKLDLHAAHVPAAQAAPLALVLNELIGNALKHALRPRRGGTLEVTAGWRPGGLEITVQDDGPGPSAAAAGGFGLTIVHLLCQQLRAEFSLRDSQPGARAVVRLPTSDTK